MYIVHIFIILIYACLVIMCSGIRLPSSLKGSEPYFIPFFKLSAGILSIYDRIKPSKSRDGDMRLRLSMLNPFDSSAELLKCFHIKSLANSLLLIFAGNLIALLLTLNTADSSGIIDNYLIPRNDYGQGDKQITVNIYENDSLILKNETLDISEKHYSDEELDTMYEKLCNELPELIKGENKNLDVVCYDLNLSSSYPGYPFTVEWKLSDYSCINSSGQIDTASLQEKESCPLELKAKISCYDYSREYSFNAMLYCLPENSKESHTALLRNLIKSYEKESVSMDKSLLPQSLNGKSLSYSRPYDTSGLLMLLFSFFLGAFIKFYSRQEIEGQLEKRRQQMMQDYPQIISRLLLLTGAGMTIPSAFEKLALDYEKRKNKKDIRYAYEEMLLTVRKLKSGAAATDAYLRFGSRCGLRKYAKLGASLQQNLKKGSAGFTEALELEESDAFEERKALAKRLGEEAGTKLLLPMILMLIIVMIIVIVPAFVSF